MEAEPSLHSTESSPRHLFLDIGMSTSPLPSTSGSTLSSGNRWTVTISSVVVVVGVVVIGVVVVMVVVGAVVVVVVVLVSGGTMKEF